MLKHVLVPLDGSELAEAALRYARHIVDPAGQLTLLTVINLPDMPIYDYYPTLPISIQEYEQTALDAVPRARNYLNQIAEGLNVPEGVKMNIEVNSGDPATAIVDAAHALHVDAIVMSTHGRSGLGRWLFGSVTQKVMTSAPCPVMVIPNRVSIVPNEDDKISTTAG